MKLIYLDIDGVLNSKITADQEHISNMTPCHINLLAKLINDCGVDGVILTSDRRCSKIDLQDKTKALGDYDIYILDTIRNPNYEIEDNRGLQILDHYNESKENIESFVILDDNDDGISNIFPNNFIKINSFYGFDENAYELATKILGV